MSEKKARKWIRKALCKVRLHDWTYYASSHYERARECDRCGSIEVKTKLLGWRKWK